MSYYTGTAANLTALRTALLTHAQADGWTLTGDVLSKAGVYFQIQETATNITCLGCESNAVANPAPNVCMIGRVYFNASYTTREIVFPCDYEVFGFGQELYLVVKYDVVYYQWMAFGKSTVPGLSGQGGWFGASAGGTINSFAASGQPVVFGMTSSVGGVGDVGNVSNCGGMFWTTSARASNQASRNCWVNHGLDGHGWLFSSSAADSPIGIRHMTTLLDIQPSGWNTEAVLLPIRAWKERPSFKVSLIADLEHARLVRIDNLAPGDILTLGSDQWKVFPWYSKNSTLRNGYVAGQNANHTGTFGWAIRYEGP